MSGLRVGFSRKNMNPMVGIGLSGYFITRLCEGVHDDLEANIIVFENDGKKAALVTLDLCEVETGAGDKIRSRVASVIGSVPEAVMVFATHTHTGPYIGIALEGSPQELTDEYTSWLISELEKGAKEACSSLSDAKIGYARTEISGIAFSRRFLMKDGLIATNPGLHNPDIVKVIGEPDNDAPVIRIDRENADTIVIANYGCHPDTVGGNYVSADWPGVFRREFEKNVPDTKAVFINGAEGEINHINVFATEEELHGMKIDFDDIPRGFGHTEYMGKIVAEAVRKVYDIVTYIDNTDICYSLKSAQIPTNRATPEELPEAHRIHALHLEGRDKELPYSGMYLTTVVAEAERMCDLEFGPDYIPTYVSALTIGKIALVGIAGEPFSAIGRGLKAVDDYNIVLPCALTNGWTGYFPNSEAYDEGGYEARSSPFRAGVAELLIEEGKKLLKNIKD